MKRLGLSTAALLAALLVGSSPASALVFYFTFTNGTNTVNGQVTGLVDNLSNQIGTVSVTASTLPQAVIGTYVPAQMGVNGVLTIVGDSFTVSGGEITDSDFTGGLFGATSWFLRLSAGQTDLTALGNTNDPIALVAGGSSLQYSQTPPSSGTTTTEVPEPASLALFGAAMVGLSAARRRRV